MPTYALVTPDTIVYPDTVAYPDGLLAYTPPPPPLVFDVVLAYTHTTSVGVAWRATNATGPAQRTTSVN